MSIIPAAVHIHLRADVDDQSKGLSVVTPCVGVGLGRGMLDCHHQVNLSGSELSAEWTSSEPSGQERDCSPVPCPLPQSRRQKKMKMFFFERARFLNAQRLPGYGHENGIIVKFVFKYNFL
jgi:hypothetical protein